MLKWDCVTGNNNTHIIRTLARSEPGWGTGTGDDTTTATTKNRAPEPTCDTRKTEQAGVTSGCNPRKDERHDSSLTTNEGTDRWRREPIELDLHTLRGIPGRVSEKRTSRPREHTLLFPEEIERLSQSSTSRTHRPQEIKTILNF